MNVFSLSLCSQIRVRFAGGHMEDGCCAPLVKRLLTTCADHTSDNIASGNFISRIAAGSVQDKQHLLATVVDHAAKGPMGREFLVRSDPK